MIFLAKITIFNEFKTLPILRLKLQTLSRIIKNPNLTCSRPDEYNYYENNDLEITVS
jgi:hypothetical protein